MICQKPNIYERETCANVQERVDAQFGHENHVSISRSQTLNRKQALGIESLKMNTFYDDKSITHNNLQ